MSPVLSRMSERANMQERLDRVARAVAAFDPLSHRLSRVSQRLSHIVELRERGASLRLIAGILTTCGIEVSHHSVARFLRRVSTNGSQPVASTKREKSRRQERKLSRPAVQPQSPDLSQEPGPLKPFPSPTIRGPRIADPSKL
jgi:hypothetical protein